MALPLLGSLINYKRETTTISWWKETPCYGMVWHGLYNACSERATNGCSLGEGKNTTINLEVDLLSTPFGTW